MIYNDLPSEDKEYEGFRRDDQERMRALERELKRAQQMYEVVVGFQGRIKWRREIDAVQTEIRKIVDAQPVGALEALDVEEHVVAQR